MRSIIIIAFQDGTAKIKSKTYGKTHFGDVVYKFNQGKCTKAARKCVEGLNGATGITNVETLRGDFIKCFANGVGYPATLPESATGGLVKGNTISGLVKGTVTSGLVQGTATSGLVQGSATVFSLSSYFCIVSSTIYVWLNCGY